MQIRHRRFESGRRLSLLYKQKDDLLAGKKPRDDDDIITDQYAPAIIYSLAERRLVDSSSGQLSRVANVQQAGTGLFVLPLLRLKIFGLRRLILSAPKNQAHPLLRCLERFSNRCKRWLLWVPCRCESNPDAPSAKKFSVWVVAGGYGTEVVHIPRT